jgi:lipopolysaccharide biosynthesis regulator YciM
MSEVDIETQLDCALQIMTKAQVDNWHTQLEVIQLQCELTDARRAIKDREYAIEQLQKQLDTAQTLLRGETSE